jgi:mannosyltransferase OCH1-like enzyme
MIPKKIHYCWFGGKPKPVVVLKCIESWERVMPEYEIIEWNEKNFDVNSHPYTKEAYKNKKYAFVSDYARLKILEEFGGVYFDTDMYLLKNIFPLFEGNVCVVCREDSDNLNAAMFASTPHNIYVKDLLIAYDNAKEREVIPKLMTRVYLSDREKYQDLKILDSIYFYPFTIETIKRFNYKNAPQESYGVHLWDYSWGHPLNKFIKKIGLHKFLKKVTEFLGIKKNIKKILKME